MKRGLNLFVIFLIVIISCLFINLVSAIDFNVTIIYPLNTSYSTNIVLINFTSSNETGFCWYSNSSGIWNSSYVNSTNRSISAVSYEGINSWTVYCNASDETENFTSVNFFKDTIQPLVYLVSPVNNFNTSSIFFNFYANVTEVNFANITFYIWNSTNDSPDYLIDFESTFTEGSLTETQLNIHLLTPISDTYTWNYYACDNYNNCAWSSANFTLTLDLIYPIFTSYWDNNASIISGGIALFNVSVKNTNGTVWLTINGTNYSATNLTENMYNVSVSGLVNGTYLYNWTAYGNGTSKNLNVSGNRYYVVNASDPTKIINCGNLTIAGTTYTLTTNIINNTITTDCIIISAQNITLDCQGFSISSVQNFSGVYSNQYNTTIKNCNITVGSGNNTESIGIELTDAADYSTIVNNTIWDNGVYGMYYGLYTAADYQNISNNNVNVSCSYCYAGYFNVVENTTFNNNLFYSKTYTSIYLNTAKNNIFNNLNVSSDSSSGAGRAVYMTSSSYNQFINVIATSNNSQAFRLDSSAYNNFTNVYGYSVYDLGLSLSGVNSNNSYVTNCIFNSSGNSGINIISGNNIIVNTTGISTGTSSSNYGIIIIGNDNQILNSTGIGNSGSGIYLSSSSNNILISNTGTSNTNNGIYILSGNYNTLIKSNGTGYSSGSYGIVVRNSSYNNISDCVYVSGVNGDVWVFNLTTGAGVGNIFTNCSYNISKETVEAGNELIRKWYYRAYVNYSNGTFVTGANVSAFNSSGSLEFSLLTDNSGWTNITTITEYINNGTRSYYSNYTISAIKDSYNNNHTYNITIKLNNLNDIFTLLLDIIPPLITIYSPFNTTYQINSINLNVSSNEDINTWWYSNNSGVNNYTFTPNITLTFQQDSTTLDVWANDSSGNIGKNTTSFFVDSIFPQISIISPANGTNTTDTGLDVNYTYIETNPSSCWWTNNSGTTNYSILSCGINLTSEIWPEGLNTIIIYINDTLGNTNNSQVSFRIDTIAPNGTLLTPTNNSYSNNYTQNLTVNATDNIFLSNVTLNVYNSSENLINQTSRTVSGTNAVLGIIYTFLYDGIFKWFYKITDIANNQFYTDNNTITVDTTNPLISFGSGTEVNYYNVSRNWIFVNVSVTETNEANITFLLYNTTGQVNSTTIGAGNRTFNWTGLSDGIYYYNVSIRDYANNLNYTETRIITLDNTPPYFTNLANQVINDNQSLNYNINATDNGVGVSCFSVNNTNNFSIDCSGVLVNKTFLPVGFYNLNISVNDTLGNTNSSVIYVQVSNSDITPPMIIIKYPTNTTYGTNISALNYTVSELTGSCWYSIDNGITNSTPVNAGNNFTGVNSIEGNNNWTVYCNDSSGNENRTLVYFIKDTTPPYFTTIPSTTNINYTQGFGVTFAASDNIGFGAYSLSNYTTLFLINQSGYLNNITQLAAGIYNINVTINDSLGNYNFTIYQVIVNQSSSIVYTYINNDRSNYSLEAGNYVWLNGSLVNGVGIIYLNNNGTLINSGNSPLSNYTFFNVSGLYNITTLYSGNQNYSSSYETFWLTVSNDATNPLIDYTFGTENNGVNKSQDYIVINITYTEINFGNITYKLYNSSGSLNITTYSVPVNTIQFNGLLNGTYYYNVTIYDSYGNYNTTQTKIITLDNGVPSASLTIPADATYSGNTQQNLTASLTDNLGIKNATIYVYNSSGNLYNSTTISFSSATTNSITGVMVNLVSDIYTWFYRLFDWAGNSAFSGNNTIILDTTNPLISFGSGTEVNYYNVSRNWIFVNVSVTETNEANITFLLYNTTGQVNSTTIGAGNRTFNWTGLSDGIYYYNVSVTDLANNINFTETRTIILDTTNPLISFGSGTEVNYYNVSRNWIFVNVSVTETNEANITFTLYNSTGQVNSTTIGAGNRTFNWTGLSDGIYYYNVSIRDYANNFNNTGTRTITLDTSAPLIIINFPISYQNLSSRTVSINLTISEANIEYTSISVYNSSQVSVNSTTSISTGNYLVNLTVPRDGIYSVYATTYDFALNSNTTYKNITVDSIEPVLNISSPINNSVYYINQSISIVFNASDVTTSISSLYYNNGSVFMYYSPTNTSYKDAGRYNITFYANDSMNNTASKIIFFNVTALPDNVTIANSTTINVTGNITIIVVPYNSSLQNITIDPNISSSTGIYLDLGQLNNNGVILVDNTFNLIRDSTNDHVLKISANTTLTAESGWDGKLMLPTIGTVSLFSISSGTVNSVIDLGSGYQITFNNPVKIVIGGQSGKRGAWARGSSILTAISTACSSPDSPGISSGECYIDSGSDLVIWSYHLTTFAAYTPTTSTPDPGSNLGNSGGSNVFSMTYSLSDEELKKGISKFLGKGDKFKFKINNIDHTVTLDSANSSIAKLTAVSSPQSITLKLSEEKKIDIDGDNFYDIKIKFNSASVSNRANISIIGLNERIPGSQQTVVSGNETTVQSTEITTISNKTINASDVKKNAKGYWNNKLLFNIWIIFIVLLIMAIITISVFIILYVIKSSRLNKNLNKNLNTTQSMQKKDTEKNVYSASIKVLDK